MDRDDAAFVANVLASRIVGAREDLERLAASSFAALLAAAAIVRDAADGWAPAEAAAAELSAIAKGGGSVCDQPLDAGIESFVEVMRKLAGEKPAMNRAQKRAIIARQPRERRLAVGRELVGFDRAPSMRIN
jgi:hypothetical protein